MSFGILNTIIPPAPQVNTVDFNTIAIVGIAPKGPAQELVVCSNDTDDSQFGKCLTGFSIPRALSTIRTSGAGKVVVVNVFDEASHTSQVTHENDTVNGQKTATAFNPTNTVLVKNTPVSPISGTAATASCAVTASGGSGDTLASLKVGLVELLAGTVTFSGASLTSSRSELVSAINAHTGVSGFSATSGSAGAFTIVGPVSAGATINGVISTIGTIVGTFAIGTNGAFSGGVTEVVEVLPVTYVEGTDYTIDDYGNIKFLIAITDGTVIRTTYKKLNAAAVVAADIIGTVSGSTRTGAKLIDACATILKLVPKILIIPGYNSDASVQIEMERLCTKYRMRTFYGAIVDLTLAGAIGSRLPGGTLATFNTSSKRAILAYPQVKTYNPQSATLTLDDPSAALAGFLAYSAAVNGPHVSTSNRVVPAIGGVETNLLHDWEDPNNAGETNQLRAVGIASIFGDGGYKLWGAENASYPDNTAVDGNICVIYVNDIITDSLTAFAKQYIDTNITSGSIAAFITAANDYYTSLMTAGWIGTDSKVSFLKDRNPDADLKLGKIRFTRNTYYFVGMKLIQLEENMEVQLPTV